MHLKGLRTCLSPSRKFRDERRRVHPFWLTQALHHLPEKSLYECQRNILLYALDPFAFLTEGMYPQTIQFERTMCEGLQVVQIHYKFLTGHWSERTYQIYSPKHALSSVSTLWGHPIHAMLPHKLFCVVVTPHFFLSALRHWDPNTISWRWVQVFLVLIWCGLVGPVLLNGG